jgi:hypothetical protein
VTDVEHFREQPSGEITLPSGMRVIDFHAAPHPRHHLPR